MSRSWILPWARYFTVGIPLKPQKRAPISQRKKRRLTGRSKTVQYCSTLLPLVRTSQASPWDLRMTGQCDMTVQAAGNGGEDAGLGGHTCQAAASLLSLEASGGISHTPSKTV